MTPKNKTPTQEWSPHKEINDMIKKVDILEKDRDRVFTYVSDAERHISEVRNDVKIHKEENNNTTSDTNKKMEQINEKIEKIEIKTTKISTDVEWLKKFFWIVATASIGSLITGLFSLLGK